MREHAQTLHYTTNYTTVTTDSTTPPKLRTTQTANFTAPLPPLQSERTRTRMRHAAVAYLTGIPFVLLLAILPVLMRRTTRGVATCRLGALSVNQTARMRKLILPQTHTHTHTTH